LPRNGRGRKPREKFKRLLKGRKPPGVHGPGKKKKTPAEKREDHIGDPSPKHVLPRAVLKKPWSGGGGKKGYTRRVLLPTLTAAAKNALSFKKRKKKRALAVGEYLKHSSRFAGGLDDLGGVKKSGGSINLL